MNTKSYWEDTCELPAFPQIDDDHKVDVVVVGAGMTGVTAAYLIKQAGFTVALMDRERVGGFDTSHTTAHLTCVTDTRLHELVSKFGKDAARGAWEAGRAAIDQIFNNIRAEGIECDFEWNPAYLFAATNEKKEIQSLQEDASLANELGFPANFMDSIPLYKRPGVVFPHQAKFHPRKYLAGLLKTIPGDGSYVFENSEVEEVLKKPHAVKSGKYKIRCSYVVLATHTPLTGVAGIVSATLFQSKLYLYTTYAVGAKIPKDAAEAASYWDTADPYHYLRVDRRGDFDYAILGGEDHKTGQLKDTVKPYVKLERELKKIFPRAVIEYRWSGQVIETVDGLPYMGETADRQFAATGFTGNGMTFGTLSAMMALDVLRKRKNPWQQLFDVNRKSVKGAWHYIRENLDYPYYMVRDWIGGAETKSVRQVRRKEGKIVQLKGKKVAVYRDEHGKLTMRSPVCTHLQCIVGWNKAEKTWDCPCHGSRFSPSGEVLSGPAEEPLEKIPNE